MEIAMPGEYFFELPAREKVIGKTAETPIPTRENPKSEGQKKGNIIAVEIPIATIEAPKI